MTGEKPRSVDQDESGRVKKCRTHLLTSGASFPPRLLILWMEIVEVERGLEKVGDGSVEDRGFGEEDGLRDQIRAEAQDDDDWTHRAITAHHVMEAMG